MGGLRLLINFEYSSEILRQFHKLKNKKTQMGDRVNKVVLNKVGYLVHAHNTKVLNTFGSH